MLSFTDNWENANENKSIAFFTLQFNSSNHIPIESQCQQSFGAPLCFLQCAKNSSQCLIYINSFNPHNSPVGTYYIVS